MAHLALRKPLTVTMLDLACLESLWLPLPSP